ncbi:hypothetical protein NDU88_002067 [Pleurodeles waltl]|uniref:Uncharacterized protein n=1 Tax=Pleurodeles waltl TaxID=8319 RepID=A0AAV7RC79_PLEWA|nr:hypothetical protein NDU88_002067 [Pleurodeles waltl]
MLLRELAARSGRGSSSRPRSLAGPRSSQGHRGLPERALRGAARRRHGCVTVPYPKHRLIISEKEPRYLGSGPKPRGQNLVGVELVNAEVRVRGIPLPTSLLICKSSPHSFLSSLTSSQLKESERKTKYTQEGKVVARTLRVLKLTEDFSQQEDRDLALIEEQEVDGKIKKVQTSGKSGGAEDASTEPGEDGAQEEESRDQENTQASAEDKEEKEHGLAGGRRKRLRFSMRWSGGCRKTSCSSLSQLKGAVS